MDADGARASIRSCGDKQHRDKSCHTAGRRSLHNSGTWPNTCLARFATESNRACRLQKAMSCSLITEYPKLRKEQPGRAISTETEYCKALESAYFALNVLLLQSRARTQLLWTSPWQPSFINFEESTRSQGQMTRNKAWSTGPCGRCEIFSTCVVWRATNWEIPGEISYRTEHQRVVHSMGFHVTLLQTSNSE